MLMFFLYVYINIFPVTSRQVWICWLVYGTSPYGFYKWRWACFEVGMWWVILFRGVRESQVLRTLTSPDILFCSYVRSTTCLWLLLFTSAQWCVWGTVGWPLLWKAYSGIPWFQINGCWSSLSVYPDEFFAINLFSLCGFLLCFLMSPFNEHTFLI